MEHQIRELRKQRDLSEEDLAEISGVPLEIIRDLEIGITDVSV
jgi:transcriptional regulator with XRE-family HTH domain